MESIKNRWRFHWPHLREVPMQVFKGGRWWVNLGGYVAFGIAVVIALNQHLGKLLLTTWTGISPFWAVVPVDSDLHMMSRQQSKYLILLQSAQTRAQRRYQYHRPCPRR